VLENRKRILKRLTGALRMSLDKTSEMLERLIKGLRQNLNEIIVSMENR
jgi:hypothetical protein